MLFDDKRWGPKPHTREHLIAWLRTKNPLEGYNYCDPQKCLYGQYQISLGEKPSWGMTSLTHYKELGDAIWQHPRTFGAALKRIEAQQTDGRRGAGNDSCRRIAMAD